MLSINFTLLFYHIFFVIFIISMTAGKQVLTSVLQAVCATVCTAGLCVFSFTTEVIKLNDQICFNDVGAAKTDIS